MNKFTNSSSSSFHKFYSNQNYEVHQPLNINNNVVIQNSIIEMKSIQNSVGEPGIE